MKVGFGKQKKRKQKSKNKKSRPTDGDDVMQDVQPAETTMAAEHSKAAGQPGSAKEKHRQRMQLKQTLKVKVAGLKANR
eukprot:jgi/Chrzof1/7693/Cz02g33060.t1